MMMGHGALGIAALLSTSAVGYFVCTKAMKEKKGSNIRAVGLVLGSVIIILSLLASLCIIAKAGYICPRAKKWICQRQGMTMQEIGKGSGPASYPRH